MSDEFKDYEFVCEHCGLETTFMAVDDFNAKRRLRNRQWVYAGEGDEMKAWCPIHGGLAPKHSSWERSIAALYQVITKTPMCNLADPISIGDIAYTGCTSTNTSVISSMVSRR